MPLEPPTILFVDDMSGNRVVFEEAFCDRFSIITAASADEALSLLEKKSVGVLVTDQRMPNMTGNDLLARVKELFPEIIRVVVTAYGDLDPILRAINEGLVARYIIKPWDAKELGKLLEWAVEAHVLGTRSSALQQRLLETESLAIIGTLSNSILHDIVQPVAYLTTNTEYLAARMPAIAALPQLLEQAPEALSVAQRTALLSLAKEMPAIVEEMNLGASIIAATAKSLRRLFTPRTEEQREEPFDPVPLVRHVIAMCRASITGTTPRLTYDGPSTLPCATVRAGEFARVLINLVTNAVQATTSSNERATQITVRAAPGNGGCSFFVEDNGPGMTADVLEKVATPFFTTRKDGTGLGLAHARRFVAGWGGELRIESVVGEGTTVSFEVPCEGGSGAH